VVRCAACGSTFVAAESPSTRTGSFETTTERAEGDSEAKPDDRDTGTGDSAERETVEHVRREQEMVEARRPEPRRVDRFLLKAEVGQGGFGKVYLAHDPRLDRPVALKVSKYAFEDAEQAARFLGEARAAARLRHPNIVAVFDSGQDGDDYFIASEFVEGVSLAQWLADDQPSQSQAVQWVHDLALALDYAHAQGIVHRDVKPGNILIGRDGRPQLTDFGLARRAEDPRVTLDGVVLGTPAYMSPEQARGEIANVGPASDQYSLGVVLYELLTGRLPFGGPRDVLMSRVAHEEPRPPRAVNRQIPPDLEAICLMAMAREPARRYASASEFARDLERFLTGEPITARRLGWMERGWRWVRRHRTAVWTLGATATAVAVTLAVVLSIPLREHGQEQIDLAGGGGADSGHSSDGATAADEPSARQEAYELHTRMTRSRVNLQQIGLAFHHYHDVYKRFPPPAVFGPDGRPLLSWRVVLLPYLDQQALYEQFRLDEPWDSEHNKPLLSLMPRVYAAPGGEYESPTETYYQVCVGPEAPFRPDPAHKLSIVDMSEHDGKENTIMVLEAATAVPWTKPEDVVWEGGGSAPRVGGLFEGFHACMFDGSVRFFQPSIYEDPPALASLLGWCDGRIVNLRPHEVDLKSKVPLASPVAEDPTARELAEKSRLISASSSQLNQIGLALYHYDEKHKGLPRHAIYGRDGTPLLSWRVALLPYLDQKALYERFKLDESWDGPHNRALVDLIPKVYATPQSQVGQDVNRTYYQVVVGPETPFPPLPHERVSLSAITGADGSGQTLLVAHAATPVVWTKPKDIVLDTPDAVPAFGGLFAEGFQACMADLSRLEFRKEIYEDAAALRALAGWRDGQLIDFNRYEGDLIEPDWLAMPPAVRSAREAVWRSRSRNNLAHLGLAMRRYVEAHGALPSPALFDPAGEPLLSWRVTLLPYLEERPLYGHFRLDEAWDSDHNRRLLAYMPRVYGVREVAPKEPFSTYYQVFAGPGAAFELDPKVRLASEDIPDGRGATLMIVEAGEAVPWSKPQDIAFDPQQPIARLGGMFAQGFHGATLDGSVRFFYRKIEEEQAVLRALVGRADGIDVDCERYSR